MALVRNLTIDQGSTFNGIVKIYIANKEAYDLTDHTAVSQIRKTPASTSVTAQFTCAINNATEGEVLISLTDEQTAVIKAGRYVYDLIVENSLGEKYRAIEGTVTVTPSITR
jgi:hypothetical protein